MKYRLFFIFCLVALSFQSFAQRYEKKVLFLLPFYLENIKSDFVIEKESDIYGNKSFEMMGFWEGAQLALKSYEKDYVRIKVIVRDVAFNVAKLQAVFTEMESENLDLIIGPMFGKPFELAAEFAKEHKIPIVNPFSNRNDFLVSNPYVYKLIPTLSQRPTALNELLLKGLGDCNIILWTNESTKTKDLPYYEVFFTEKGIATQTVALSSGFSALKGKLVNNKKNVIIACFEGASVAVIQNMQSLAQLTDEKQIYLVAPESWLDIKNSNFSDLDKLHYHFFANYFVDKKDASAQLFADEYLTEFGSYPDLQRFSFQGYDVTNYFMDLMINDFDLSKVKYQPIGFKFDFKSSPDNGYENQWQRLINMKDLELQEVGNLSE
ncbi:MAG: ABC transporter substrate-binding protein [Bacteroidales bacterium]|nr:ABC transporter substrate-binding protein [Bacteroidales bacterium]